MLAYLSVQFMASVVINGRKPQSLVVHIIKRTGTLLQQIKKRRPCIIIRGSSCCLFLIASVAVQYGWKHLQQDNFVTFASVTYSRIVCFYIDNCLEFTLYIRIQTHVV
jgi:hypothetical protein